MLGPHLEELRTTYRTRRDLLAEALRRELGETVRFTVPAGGLYLWCLLPDEVRVRDLLPEAARRGVAFAPGESFFVDPTAGRHWMRLNFTYPNPPAIVEGVRRLAQAITAVRETRTLARHAPAPIV